jgi:hypothetical protein
MELTENKHRNYINYMMKGDIMYGIWLILSVVIALIVGFSRPQDITASDILPFYILGLIIVSMGASIVLTSAYFNCIICKLRENK